MTDEEIREIRAKALKDDLASINNRLHHAFNQGFELGRKSTTPKEKTGKWILTDVEGNRVWHCNCSECDKDLQDYIGGSENWWIIKHKLPKYCPNCGRKMVSE